MLQLMHPLPFSTVISLINNPTDLKALVLSSSTINFTFLLKLWLRTDLEVIKDIYVLDLFFSSHHIPCHCNKSKVVDFIHFIQNLLELPVVYDVTHPSPGYL